LKTGITCKSNRWHIGLNGISYHFSLPVQKRNEPYNIYAVSGRNWLNYSVDYSYTHKNIHLFGEAAIDKNFNKAFLNGILVSVDSRVDLSLVHRNIDAAYQAVNGNAFTENTYPTNETGLYTGITIRPYTGWRIDAYADLFKFPWLKYLVDAPSRGKEFCVQVTFTPNKQVEIYSRFRNETKQANQPENTTVTNFLVTIPKQNWRTQVSYKINSTITVRNRIELIWYDRKGINTETGFLGFFDFKYKPLLNPFSVATRVQYIETGGYNSRLYAYENDVLYSYSIPPFFDKGFRYYILLNYDLGKKITCWLRLAQTKYLNRNSIGSGLDEINGNRKTEIKFQVRLSF